MSSTLIAIIAALALGHVLPALATMRRFTWFDAWLEWLGKQAPTRAIMEKPLGLLLTVALPALLVGALAHVLSHWLWGFPGFLFAVAVLSYALGPRDLEHDVEQVLQAESAETARQAAGLIGGTRASDAFDAAGLVETTFEAALQRWFAVLLAFVVLGPGGAMLYRLCARQRSSANARWASAASGLKAILEWPAAQMMTLSLALVADFDHVLETWREWHRDGLGLDHGFLHAAARVSVHCELAEERADGNMPLGESPTLFALRDAMSLIWRILLVWLALMALIVLAGWVG